MSEATTSTERPAGPLPRRSPNTRLDSLLGDIQEAELELAHQLAVVADRHAANADLFHQGHSQARLCAARVERLRPWLLQYGTPLLDPADAERSGPLETVRQRAATILGRAEPTAVMMLHDLRDTYLFAVQNELNWLLLMHVAEAQRDHALLEEATESHERAEACMKWLRTRQMVSVAQVILAP